MFYFSAEAMESCKGDAYDDCVADSKLYGNDDMNVKLEPSNVMPIVIQPQDLWLCSVQCTLHPCTSHPPVPQVDVKSDAQLFYLQPLDTGILYL